MSSSHHGASAPPPPSQLLSLFLNPQPGGGGESSTYSLKRKRDPDEVDEKKSTDLQDAQTLQARGKFRTFEEARTYVRELGLKSWREWWAWSKSGARPHDIPSKPHTTYASSGYLSIGDFLGYAGGNVTGAYKRNAAVAGLRALLDNGADNDEKDEQDGDDDCARRHKQAKRPRGG